MDGKGALGVERSTTTATAPRDAHTDASGHASHDGARGRHTSEARSITASNQRPGSSRETSSSAAACRPGDDAGTPRTRDTTRRTFTSSGATGTPNAAAATARAVYGPIPGSASRASIVDGTLPPCSATIVRAASRNARARRL